MSSTSCPRMPVLLITHARSGSNLLERMLFSKQSDGLEKAYNFSVEIIEARRRICDRPLEQASAQELEECFRVYQASCDKVVESLALARDQGKILCEKEHATFMLDPVQFSTDMHGSCPLTPFHSAARTSCSVLPDELLLGFRPLFLIRNPIRTIPSFARVAARWDSAIAADSTLANSRRMFEWYFAQSDGQAPLLLDADDILMNPTMLEHVCTELGLNPKYVVYEWDVVSEEEKSNMPAIAVKMEKTLYASTGLIQGKSGRGLDVQVETEAWKTEFGETQAQSMAHFLRIELDNYEFLREKRIRPSV